MEIDAFLADSVVNAEGKLYAQGGGWNTITTANLPFRHPRVGIGILIRVPYTGTNEVHSPDVRLEDGDGRQIALGETQPGPDAPDGKLYRLRTQFNLGRPPQLRPGDDQLVALAMNIDGLVFDREDGYRFVIAMDGQDSKTLPLRVMVAGQLAPGRT